MQDPLHVLDTGLLLFCIVGFIYLMQKIGLLTTKKHLLKISSPTLTYSVASSPSTLRFISPVSTL